MNKLNFSTIITTLLAVLFIGAIFIFPSEAIEASRHGISLWFNTLFPAQFPFIIGANILIGIGAVNLIGVLLEPIMRSIFNISGTGAFPFIMGMLSGCPVGSKITGDLRHTNEISHSDATRIMSICNNSGLLFILGTVAIGLFKNAQIGFQLIFITYLSALSTGLLFRFWGPTEKNKLSIERNPLLKKAFNKQIEFRINNKKSIGTLLSESIMNAMEVVVKIGGFVIFFCVVSTLLSLSPVIPFLEYILSPVFSLFNIDKSLYRGLLIGLIEVTNGIDLIAHSTAPLKQQLITTSCLLSWCGLSIHAQAISMVAHTDIKIAPYLGAKIIQTALAGIYAYILF
jgi:sporulation integral membrane protein YlbJ